MKKTILFIAFLLIVVQASAYTYALRRANDTVRIPLVESAQVNTWKLSSEINFWLQLNKAGCSNPFKSVCRVYRDFPIPLKQNSRASLGSIRVYGGIERVSVWETVDYKGIKWLNIRAHGNSHWRNYNSYNYRYYNANSHWSYRYYNAMRQYPWHTYYYKRWNPWQKAFK